MRRPLPLIPLAVALAIAGSPAATAGQSARDVLETAMEGYEERMQGIDDYTIVQAVDGTETTLFFERVESESGRSLFRSVTPAEFRERAPGGGDGAALAAANPYTLLDEMTSRASLRGTESVDGREAHVIVVEDLSGADLGWADEANEETRFQPRSASFWIDADRYVVLRSSVTGLLETERGASEVTAESRMSDYRDVEGMLHPFRSEVRIDGLGGAMSAEDREQLRRAREEMERQLEGLSGQQRAMVEKMMKERMPNLEAMAGGTMAMTMEVREIRVNQGPPASMQANVRMRDRMEEAREQRASEREEERRRREAESRRVREPARVDPAEHEMRYPEYGGLYESTGERETTFFVTERCGSGALAIGSMRGDVAPWVFDEADDGEFRAPPISPGGSEMHVRFGTGAGDEPVFEILSGGWEEFGSFRRSGELPERWDRCMQRPL